MPDALQLALAHYALQFPTLNSLGVNAVTWKAEYDRVAESGLSATLVNSTTSEGTSIGSMRNFDQQTLLWALHLRRAQLDDTYTAPFEPVPMLGARRLGITVQLGPSCGLTQL
jgi:hypothetical protein